MAFASNLGSTVIEDPGLVVLARRRAAPGAASFIGQARRVNLAAGAIHAMALAMQDQRALDAIARIERALDRIEAATADREAAHRQAEELERIRSAHFALRSRVQTAIGEIDRMLEPNGGAAS